MRPTIPHRGPVSDTGAPGAKPGPDAELSKPELEPPTPAELAAEAPPEPAAAPGSGDTQRAARAAGPEAVPHGEDTEAARHYKDRWLRAEAELQNFRRRAQRDVEEARQFVEERGLITVLEQLDDLERALEAARGAGAPERWVEGVELVAQRMREHLARHGVREIQAVGAPFDPGVHEALLEMEPKPGIAPGHVMQVVRKGYERGGRALRPARVVVAKRPG